MTRRELQQDAGRWRAAAGHILPLILTTSISINTHLSVAARGLTPPRPRPGHRLPNICRQGAQHPGARSQRCEGLRQETFLPSCDAIRKSARLIFIVFGMLKVLIFVFVDYSFAKSTLYISQHLRTFIEEDYTFTSPRTVSQTEC